MPENTNNTILEVQGSFSFTYMVGIIPLNLRSQEMDKAGLVPGVAWQGRQAGGERAWVVVLIFSTH
jgi:hypothetical protein